MAWHSPPGNYEATPEPPRNHFETILKSPRPNSGTHLAHPLQSHVHDARVLWEVQTRSPEHATAHSQHKTKCEVATTNSQIRLPELVVMPCADLVGLRVSVHALVVCGRRRREATKTTEKKVEKAKPVAIYTRTSSKTHEHSAAGRSESSPVLNNMKSATCWPYTWSSPGVRRLLDNILKVWSDRAPDSPRYRIPRPAHFQFAFGRVFLLRNFVWRLVCKTVISNTQLLQPSTRGRTHRRKHRIRPWADHGPAPQTQAMTQSRRTGVDEHTGIGQHGGAVDARAASGGEAVDEAMGLPCGEGAAAAHAHTNTRTHTLTGAHKHVRTHMRTSPSHPAWPMPALVVRWVCGSPRITESIHNQFSNG